MTVWIKQKNKTLKSNDITVSIRTLGIGISSKLIKEDGLEDCKFVEVFLNEDKTAIALKFLAEKSDSSYHLTQDGGSKERKRVTNNLNRFVACGNVIRNNPELSQLADRAKPDKLIARKMDDLWVINLAPCFLYSTSNRVVGSEDHGVYRYIFNDEIVYIGKGNILSRISSKERTEWEFDTIEYLLADKEDSIKIESSLIQEFKDEYGMLPRYNKILGCGK